MLPYRTIILWAACWLAPLAMQAQFVNYGTDPYRFKWNEITLEHYKLIYPQGLDSMAFRYALYLEHLYPQMTKTIGQPLKVSFPVVLHPANRLSNGMVSWSPRRMELLTTPSPRQHAEAWDRHLVLHESRHVVQTSKLMRGVFRPLYYLIGEQTAGVSSLFVPRWFFEGDAVATETALSNSGRGRLPEFQMVYRAQMLSGGSPFFSFDKWYLGSYKDYTGDFYALGYNLTSFARHQYGAGIWEKTTDRYVSRFFAIPPFGKAFKHHTGIGFDQLFGQTFDFLRKEWESKDSNYLTPHYLTPETKQYRSYQYPQAWNDSTLIGLRSELSDISSLVAIVKGKERRLAYTGSLSGRISLHRDHVYWLESQPDLRWSHENHTVIKRYDLLSGRIRTLTPPRAYISCAPGDSLLAASLFTEKGENRIALVDRENGHEYKQYPTPANAFVKDLVWGGQDTLFVLAISENNMCLLSLDTQTGQWDEWMKPTSANINALSFSDGRVYFESGFDGINNIYALEPTSRKIYRLTAARFGAFQPAWSAGGKQLLYADYQANGYRMASLPADSLLREETPFESPARFSLAETISQQEGFTLEKTAALPAIDLQARPYAKASHLFHIHSWAPFYYNVDELVRGGSSNFTSALKPGATLISQNALNTAITQAGWYYNRGDHHAKLDFLYMGWFPVIHLNVDYGGKAYDMRWGKNDDNQLMLYSLRGGRKLVEASLRAYAPLNLTRNHYYSGIQPSISYYFTNHRYQQYGGESMAHYQYMLSEIRLYHYRRMAQRDILPRWGFQLNLQYLNMPFNSANFGSLYAARLTTYWPGVGPNHSLMLRAAFQYQPGIGKPLYITKQLIEAPRGYDYSYHTYRQAGFKADYAFPLLSPDFSLGSLAYVQRLRANLFYDLTYNQPVAQSGWAARSSLGGEFLFDWNALRFTFPLTTGLRVIRPLSPADIQTELMFSISF